VSGGVKFFCETWVCREAFVGRWGVGTRGGIFAGELLWARNAKIPRANAQVVVRRMWEEVKNGCISCGHTTHD